MSLAGIVVVYLALVGCSKDRPAPDTPCWSTQIPHDILNLSNVLIAGDALKPSTQHVDAQALQQWITKSSRLPQSFVSPIIGEGFLFCADSGIGPVIIMIAVAYIPEDGMQPVTITVQTTGNPSLIYRYRVLDSDMAAFMDWAHSQTDEPAPAAAKPQ